MQIEKKIVAVIEARMNSTRLPGKVLLPVRGISLLEFMIARVKKVSLISEIVVATTGESIDNQIQSLAYDLGVSCFRGSENDVMGRVLGAAKTVNANIIVGLTADCPIIDPFIISQVLNTYLENDARYVSNAHVRSYPDGMDVQVYSTETLVESYDRVTTDREKEHVTLNIRENPEVFPPIHLVAPQHLYEPGLGLTLDERRDYDLLSNIINYFHPSTDFTCEDVIKLLDQNLNLRSLNADVLRKGVD